MVELQVEKKELQWLLRVARDVRQEVLLIAKDNALRFSHTDPSNVYYVRASVEAEIYEEGKFVVDTYRLYDVVCKMKGPVIDIELGDVLKFIDSGENGRVVYKAEVIDPSWAKPTKSPKLDLPVTFTIRVEDLRDAVNKAAALSDEAVFEAEDSDIKVISEGNGVSMIYTLDVDYVGEEFKARYNAEILSMLVKLLRGDIVTVSIGTNLPVRLESEHGDYVAMLAPRLEGEV